MIYQKGIMRHLFKSVVPHGFEKRSLNGMGVLAGPSAWGSAGWDVRASFQTTECRFADVAVPAADKRFWPFPEALIHHA